MMQGAWEPLIQKLSAAAADGPKHKNHARCYFYYTLHTMYVAKPAVSALSPSNIGSAQLTLPMATMLLLSAFVLCFDCPANLTLSISSSSICFTVAMSAGTWC